MSIGHRVIGPAEIDEMMAEFEEMASASRLGTVVASTWPIFVDREDSMGPDGQGISAAKAEGRVAPATRKDARGP